MRRLSLITSIFLIILLFNCTAFAASTTNKYQVFVTKLQLYNSDTGLWVTVYEGTSGTLDIASVSSGQAAGNFMSGVTVPDGTYTKAKSWVSPTFIIRGSVDSTYYTTAATSTTGTGGRTASVASLTAGDIADCTVTVLSDDVEPDTNGVTFSNGSLKVTGGIPDHKVRVSFDLSNALTQTGGKIYPGAPVVTISVE